MPLTIDNFGTKYRPSCFSDLIGSTQALSGLRSLLGTGRSASTYLVHGPYGCGKTTVGALLARSLLCKNPTSSGEPCGVCMPCRQPLEANTDYQYLNSASLGVADVRSLIDTVRYRPNLSAHRVVVLDEAHRLTPASQSELLIPMEAPPPHLVWILSTNQTLGLKPEIISRCYRVSLSVPSESEVAELINRVALAEHLSVPDATVSEIVRLSGCHYRDALHILQAGADSNTLQSPTDIAAVAPVSLSQITIDLVGLLLRGDSVGALRLVSGRSDAFNIIKSLATVLSRLAVFMVSGDGLPVWEQGAYAELASLPNRPAWSSCLLQMLPDSESLVQRASQFTVDDSVLLNNFILRWSLSLRSAVAP